MPVNHEPKGYFIDLGLMHTGLGLHTVVSATSDSILKTKWCPHSHNTAGHAFTKPRNARSLDVSHFYFRKELGP